MSSNFYGIVSWMIVVSSMAFWLVACDSGDNIPASATEEYQAEIAAEYDIDTDNDGYSDREEKAVGTDPHSPEQKPQSEDQVLSSDVETALRYFNSFRVGSGLTPLKYSQALGNASRSHENYLGHIYTEYGIHEGHFENYRSPHYTGFCPNTRCQRAGYGGAAGELISYRQNGDVLAGIDELMSAIYHRNGLLAYYASDVGIGGFSDLYSFRAQVFNFGFTSDEVVERMKAAAKIIAYPYDGETNVRRVFYDESPDPLPDISESGNPISVTFNPYYVDKVEVISFELFESDGTKVDNVLFMDSNNDPNRFFNDTDFALFPLSVLKASHRYSVRLEYNMDGEHGVKEWNFITRENKDRK